ncbi:MAG TPA: hypothetical protein VGN69_09770 [Solirubrobacteraceae bacterium]|jgi:hypothetical protein|nr:hypothetical protein [Solirubrobacteraceae bacterium]
MSGGQPRPLLGMAAGLAVLLALGACGGNTTTVESTTARTTTTPSAAQAGAQASAGTGGGAGVVGSPGSASTNVPGVDASGASTVSSDGTTIAGQPTSTLVRPFAASSPWNTPVETFPTDPRSATYMRLVQQRVGIIENGNVLRTFPRQITAGLFINTRKWTTPVVDEQGGQPTGVVCRQLQSPEICGDGLNLRSLLIPPNVSPLPQYDGWFTVLNRREGVAYDMWRARRGANGGLISYQFMRKWSLLGPGYQKPNTVSARGSGLPLFAGLILPEEIQAGRIEHALAISLPGPAARRYVQPASASDGIGNLNSLPEGARIRLKPGATFGRLPGRTSRRAAQAILLALRRYGAILVDRSAVPTLYAKLNYNWANPLRDANGRLLDANGRALTGRLARRADQGTPLLRGNEAQGLHMSDFEVVQLPTILNFPPLNSTPAASTFTPVIP